MTNSSWPIRTLACGLLLSFCAGLISAQTLVNVATDATDPRNLPDVEPSIAINPLNPREIVIATFSEKWKATQGAPIWRSQDGGATWEKIFVIPRPPSLRSGPGDQFVAYDSSGKLFLSQLDHPAGIGDTPFNYIYRQNGSVTSNFIPGKEFGDDQPLIEVHREGGPCANRIYSPWLEVRARPVSRERSMVTHSRDSGATVTTIVGGEHAGAGTRTTRLTIAPDGGVYIFYKTRLGTSTSNFEPATFRVARSDDCGVTWTGLGGGGVPVHPEAQVQTWFTKQFGNPGKGKVNRARSSDGWIAADPSDGDIYAAYVSRDASGFGQIYVARSTNRGATWVSRRVTDGRNHSAFPALAVAANGTIGFLYIDYDDSGPRTIFRHRFARSFDNGATWTDLTLQSMDPDRTNNYPNEFIWGDYEGLTAAGNTFFGVFTGESLPGKRTLLQLDPIFFTVSAEP
ncbi:MAG TPA: sialidase family protein [Pyrinomonadaceae bacterium]|nr:sialidase family protein [Pyrinomonadaceae bacterium]